MADSKSSSLFLYLAMSFALLISAAVVEGRDHLVGGKAGAWKIPSSPSDSLSKWSSNSRFLPGDSLVWNFDPKSDSVLEVTRDAYLACNTTNPISEHKETETKVKLDRSGPYYFISGAEGHCEKGEKVIVVVMARRGGHHHLAPSPSPASSSDVEAPAPAVAPTSAGVASRAGFMVVALGFLVVVFSL